MPQTGYSNNDGATGELNNNSIFNQSNPNLMPSTPDAQPSQNLQGLAALKRTRDPPKNVAPSHQSSLASGNLPKLKLNITDRDKNLTSFESVASSGD